MIMIRVFYILLNHHLHSRHPYQLYTPITISLKIMKTINLTTVNVPKKPFTMSSKSSSNNNKRLPLSVLFQPQHTLFTLFTLTSSSSSNNNHSHHHSITPTSPSSSSSLSIYGGGIPSRNRSNSSLSSITNSISQEGLDSLITMTTQQHTQHHHHHHHHSNNNSDNNNAATTTTTTTTTTTSNSEDEKANDMLLASSCSTPTTVLLVVNNKSIHHESITENGTIGTLPIITTNNDSIEQSNNNNNNGKRSLSVIAKQLKKQGNASSNAASSISNNALQIITSNSSTGTTIVESISSEKHHSSEDQQLLPKTEEEQPSLKRRLSSFLFRKSLEKSIASSSRLEDSKSFVLKSNRKSLTNSVASSPVLGQPLVSARNSWSKSFFSRNKKEAKKDSTNQEHISNNPFNSSMGNFNSNHQKPNHSRLSSSSTNTASFAVVNSNGITLSESPDTSSTSFDIAALDSSLDNISSGGDLTFDNQSTTILSVDTKKPSTVLTEEITNIEQQYGSVDSLRATFLQYIYVQVPICNNIVLANNLLLKLYFMDYMFGSSSGKLSRRLTNLSAVLEHIDLFCKFVLSKFDKQSNDRYLITFVIQNYILLLHKYARILLCLRTAVHPPIPLFRLSSMLHPLHLPKPFNPCRDKP